MDKRKTGIALFITLMVIASIISIMAISFTYLDRAKKDAGVTSALIQTNLIYGNTVEVLNRFFPSGSNNAEKLKLIYSMPLLLSEEKSNFSVNLTCHALINAVPVNWLDSQFTFEVQEKETLAKDTLNYIIDHYDIVAPNQLESLLLQAITGKTLESNDFKPRLKRQKGIVSKAQFYRVIMDYATKNDDLKSLNVPWNKYFSFVQVNKTTKIDGAYPSAEFVSAAFDIPIDLVKDAWNQDLSLANEGSSITLASFLKENSYPEADKKIYSDKALNAMHCKETFLYKGEQYGFNFNYIEGRSDNFEFNGQE